MKLLEQAEKTQPCANENQNWGEKRKDKIKTGLVPRGCGRSAKHAVSFCDGRGMLRTVICGRNLSGTHGPYQRWV